MHPEALYRILAAAFVGYCWWTMGWAGAAGACVMVGLNEWVRRTGGYS